METLYRKVKVSERLPKEDGNYYTEQGLITFEKGTFWQYEGRAFVKSNSNITNFLEPIPNNSHQIEKLTANKEELLEALQEFVEAVKDESIILQNNTDEECANYLFNKAETAIKKATE